MIKQKLLLLLLLLIGSIAWAENGFLSTIPIIHPQYGQLYQYEPKGVYPLPDGSMYVLGTAGWEDDLNGIPWSYGPVVTLLDPNGNLVWHRYPEPFAAQRNVTFINIDDELSIHYLVNRGARYNLDKTDLLGLSSVGTDHMFQNQILDVYRAKRLSYGDILIAGSLHGKALLARLSATGDTISVARYTKDLNSGITSPMIVDIDIDDEGNVVSLCCLSSLIPATILKTDPDGIVLARYDFNDTTFVSGMPLEFIADDFNGEYEMFILATLASGVSSEQCILSFRNYTISVLDILPFFSDLGILGLTRMDNYRYFLARGSGGACISKFDTEGNMQWIWYDQRTWRFTDHFQDNIALLGEKIIAVGSDNAGHNLFASELLPNGQVDIDDEVDAPSSYPIIVYPNPMTDKVTIQTLNKIGSNTFLSIYNIRGEKIRTLDRHLEKSQWDGKDDLGNECSNGVYIIKNNSTNDIVHVVKIK